MVFDTVGRPVEERRRGEVFTLGFDNLGRTTSRNAPGTQPDVSLSYDLLGRETLRSFQSGHSLTTTYDALSRVSSVSSSVLGAVLYQYDAAGRRTQMDYPGGFYVTYGYNTAGDLTGIFENGSASLAAYGYDDLGRRTSLSRGGGVLTTSYSAFDGLSRLTTLVQNPSATSHDTTFTLGYNPASQITSRSSTNGVFGWAAPPSFSDNYTANGLDQYTNVNGVTPGYSYSRGNLIGDGVKVYGYDADNRMISASGGVTLNYDPAGRLHQIAVGGAPSALFLYDGADLIAEYSTPTTVAKRYVHGPGADEPLVEYTGSGTGSKRYLMADERGSVMGLTNGSGSVTSVNTYDAYGVPGAANSGRFQYTGQVWLPEVGVYHYKARAYDPKLGRFLQTDPIGVAGGMNLYGYVGNDPVNFTDPSGLCEEGSYEWFWRDNAPSDQSWVRRRGPGRDLDECLRQLEAFLTPSTLADNSPAGGSGSQMTSSPQTDSPCHPGNFAAYLARQRARQTNPAGAAEEDRLAMAAVMGGFTAAETVASMAEIAGRGTSYANDLRIFGHAFTAIGASSSAADVISDVRARSVPAGLLHTADFGILVAGVFGPEAAGAFAIGYGLGRAAAEIGAAVDAARPSLMEAACRR